MLLNFKEGAQNNNDAFRNKKYQVNNFRLCHLRLTLFKIMIMRNTIIFEINNF